MSAVPNSPKEPNSPDNVTSVGVALRHHVEEKGLDVEIESFVVEKEFGQQTQILTVHFVLLSVHFKHGNVIFSINLIARRMAPHALSQVAPQDGWAVHDDIGNRGKKETKIAKTKLRSSKNSFINQPNKRRYLFMYFRQYSQR